MPVAIPFGSRFEERIALPPATRAQYPQCTTRVIDWCDRLEVTAPNDEDGVAAVLEQLTPVARSG